MDMEDISSLLRDRDIYYNRSKICLLIKLVTFYMNKGCNMEKEFPYMVKLLALNDIRVRKCVHKYLVNYTQKASDDVILAVNSLQQETRQSNPLLRGLALRTLTSLRIESLLQYITEPISRGLRDKSSYVRRTAVLACLSIHRLDAALVTEHGLVNELYGMIRDPDSLVILNSLHTLNELLSNEGGVVVNKNMAYYLLNDLSRFRYNQFSAILPFLHKYLITNEEEALEILNLIDPYLDSHDFSVISAIVTYVVRITEGLVQLRKAIADRIGPTVIGTLCTGSCEETYALLTFFENVPDCFSVAPCSITFCKYNDPVYLKVTKLRFLPNLFTVQNADEIIDELLTFCAHRNSDISKAAFDSYFYVIQNYDGHKNILLSYLTAFLHLDIEHIYVNMLDLLHNLTGDSEVRFKVQEIFLLNSTNHHLIKSSHDWMIFFNLLAEFASTVQESPYIIEEIINTSFDRMDSLTKSVALSATVSVFLTYPAQTHLCLTRIYEKCTADTNHYLQDRLKYYYYLLKSDAAISAFVITGKFIGEECK